MEKPADQGSLPRCLAGTRVIFGGRVAVAVGPLPESPRAGSSEPAAQVEEGEQGRPQWQGAPSVSLCFGNSGS